MRIVYTHHVPACIYGSNTLYVSNALHLIYFQKMGGQFFPVHLIKGLEHHSRSISNNTLDAIDLEY